MNTVAEVKRIDGKPAVRLAHMLAGTWLTAKTEIDAIIQHVLRELPGLTRTELYEAVDIPWASVTLVRQGVQPIQDGWLLRLQDYSGIPIEELRMVGCIGPSVPPHNKARRK
jgi:hypothetical protein